MGQSAVDYTVIRVEERSVFRGAHANLGSLGRTSLAQVLRTQGRVRPCNGSQIKGFAKDVALCRTVPHVRQQKARLPDALPGGRGDVWQAGERDHRYAENF